MIQDVPSVVETLTHPVSTAAALAVLAEPVRTWFTRKLGEPTAAQRLAWPALALRHHLLLCAPTGAGKTLAAFCPLIGQLLTESLEQGVRCLYIAPLKALANDVRKGLRRALTGIRAHLPPESGKIRIGLRTGDTPDRLRRRLMRQPPEILLTTPETLAILLSQASARDLFGNLQWIVVDEIHALAAGKRGCDLALSLERLAAVACRDVQRIGLSATCTPTDEAARFLVGQGRHCLVAEIGDPTALELRVEYLEAGTSFLAALTTRLEPELRRNRSTLLFTNTRSLAERLSWRLRQQFPEWIDQIAVHHSSLARIRRRRVERALKQGRLRAVVSSTSLELGIDIGTVDGVILVHPPGDVVRLLQRVGRSGHGPGQVRRGLVLTASPGELLEAAVAGASGRSIQCEPLRIPSHPLDVLCQVLVGIASIDSWTADDSYALVRRAYPFRHLTRGDFQSCLDYLSGWKSKPSRDSEDESESGRTSWLPPRLVWDGDFFTIVDVGTARLLRRNLGTILAEEPKAIRLTDGSAVGELEERFVERLNPGDRFLLDGRCLEYRRLEGEQMVVEEVIGRPMVPRWTTGGLGLSAELAMRLYGLRERAAEALRAGPKALAQLLRDEYHLEDEAANVLAAYFEEQERLSEIPDSRTLLIEIVPRQGATDCFLHTPLSRAGNDALCRVAVHRLLRDRACAVHSLVADLGFHLSFTGAAPAPEEWRGLLTATAFDADLTEALQESTALRERFGRVAITGLMLLRNPLGGRQRVGGHDWGERRLFDQVRTADPHFVLLRQAEDEVRQEVCDATAARRYAETLPAIAICYRRLTRISPFVEGWTQVTPGPEAVTLSPDEALQRLHEALMAEEPTHAHP